MQIKNINTLLRNVNLGIKDGKEITVFSLSNYVIFFVGEKFYRLRFDTVRGAEEVAATFEDLVNTNQVPEKINIK